MQMVNPLIWGHLLNSIFKNNPMSQFWQHYKNNDQTATLVQNKNDQTIYNIHNTQCKSTWPISLVDPQMGWMDI